MWERGTPNGDGAPTRSTGTLCPGRPRESDAEKEQQAWTAEQEVDAKQGKLPSIAWTTFKSWEAVGAWYKVLERDRVVPDAAVKTKAAELTAGKTTEEEKVLALYGYVATQTQTWTLDESSQKLAARGRQLFAV